MELRDKKQAFTSLFFNLRKQDQEQNKQSLLWICAYKRNGGGF
jgi:hypothetical protein